MQEFLKTLEALPLYDEVCLGLKAAIIVIAGFVLAKLIYRRFPLPWLHPQHRHIIQRMIKYTIIAISISWALHVLGVNLGVLLGAAGILTVALGFAAQTSASNLISGIFLMAERPFVIGDVIKIGDTMGVAVSVDLLSVRLRTFDNLLVRIPNESMLKSNITNLTHFPIRRVDIRIGVAYKEDLEFVKETLMEVAEANPICFTEPKPLIIFLGYGDSSVDFQFSVWGQKENFLELRNGMYVDIKRAFDEKGIEIPFPHRTIYTGSVTEPFPLRVETIPQTGDTEEQQ